MSELWGVSVEDGALGLVVVLVAGRVPAALFGWLIGATARRGGTALISLARAGAAVTAIAGCSAGAWWAPEPVGGVAVVCAVVIAWAAVTVTDPRPGPSPGAWLRWLSRGGALGTTEQWLEVVLCYAKATGDPRPAFRFVERVRPCLTERYVTTWPEYVRAAALSAADRDAEAAARLGSLRKGLREGDPLAGAVELAHVAVVLGHALATGTTPSAARLDDCARVLGRLVPDAVDETARLHTEAVLQLFRDRPAAAAELARRSRAGATSRWDAAVLDATIAIALARAGDLDAARRYLDRVPPSCSLYRAACREILGDGLLAAPARS